MGNTYFKHRSLHKYTKVARCQDGVEIRSRIDLVLAAICAGCEGGERDGTGNGRKCKRSVCLSESRGKEPKECVMEP